MSSNGIFWLLNSSNFADREWTNFYTFYLGFEEIELLEVEAMFQWQCKVGLDVLLGIVANSI